MSSQSINGQINTFLENFEIDFDPESGQLSYGTVWGPKKIVKVGRGIKINPETNKIDILDEGRTIQEFDVGDVFKSGLADELKGFQQFETLKAVVETKSNGQVQLKHYGKNSKLVTEPDALVGLSDDGSLVVTPTQKKPSIRLIVDENFRFIPSGGSRIINGFLDASETPGWIEDRDLFSYSEDGVIVKYSGKLSVSAALAYETRRQRTAISFYVLVNDQIASPYFQNNYVRGLTNHFRSSQDICYDLMVKDGDLIQLAYEVFSGDTRQDNESITVDGKLNYLQLKVG